VCGHSFCCSGNPTSLHTCPTLVGTARAVVVVLNFKTILKFTNFNGVLNVPMLNSRSTRVKLHASVLLALRCARRVRCVACHTYCHTYYYWYSITHSLFHSRLKSFLFCKSSLPHPFLFLLQVSLYGFPRLFTVTSEHIRLFTFYFFCFYTFLVVGSVR